jgi:hypothetical protein
MGQQPTQGPPKPEPTMKCISDLIPRTSQIVHHANQPNQAWATKRKIQNRVQCQKPYQTTQKNDRKKLTQSKYSFIKVHSKEHRESTP